MTHSQTTHHRFSPLKLNKHHHAIGSSRATAAHAAPDSHSIAQIGRRGRAREFRTHPGKRGKPMAANPNTSRTSTIWTCYSTSRFRSRTQHWNPTYLSRQGSARAVRVGRFHHSSGARENQPGTAEVFGGVTSGSDEIVKSPLGFGSRIFSRLASGRARTQSEGPRTADDDADSRGLGTWMSVLLLSYASAVTIGLVWMIWTGQTFRAARTGGAERAWTRRGKALEISRTDCARRDARDSD